MTLTFTQGHRGYKEAELWNHSLVKWHKVAQTFTLADYVLDMTAKESGKYGRYVSFEHLLFLF